MISPLLLLALLGAAQSTGQMSPTSDVSSNRVKATGASTARALRDHVRTLPDVDWGAVGLGSASVTASGSSTAAPLRDWAQTVTSAASGASAYPVTGGTASRPDKDRWSDVFNVKEYGAVGDCSTNDAPAIQAAVNAAIASGRGRIYFPNPSGGCYAITSMIDLTRSTNVHLEVYGDHAKIKSTAGSVIQAVIKTRKPGANGVTVIRDLIIDANSKAYYGIQVEYTGGSSEVVSIENVEIYRAWVGLDLDSVMSSKVSHSIINECVIALRLRAHATDGGGNANGFYSLKMSSNSYGIVLYPRADTYPMHDNTFTDTLIQGSAGAGVVAFGSNSFNHVFVGGHFENSLSAGSVPLNLGDFEAPYIVTVSKSDVATYSAGVKFDHFYGLHRLVSGTHASVEAGRGSTLGWMVGSGSVFGPAGPNVRYRSFSGVGHYFDRVMLQADAWSASVDYFDRSVVTSRVPTPPYTPYSRNLLLQATTYSSIAETVSWDSALGKVLSGTFAASTGSYGSNDLRWDAGGLALSAGHAAYITFLIRSNTANATFYADAPGSGASTYFGTPEANVWYLVRTASAAAAGGGSAMSLSIYPTDTLGATVDVARVALLDLGTVTEAARTSAQAVNSNAGPSDLIASATWDPASIATGASLSSSDIAVTGAELGNAVSVVAPYDLQGLSSSAYVRAAGQVRVVLTNNTAGAVDLASGTWVVRVRQSF